MIYRLAWLLVFLCGCSQNDPHYLAYQKWIEPNGKVKVLSTISMIDDIVKQVGGDYVDSVSLIKGELDPHSYQLVKGDDEKLAYADLIFSSGLGLEHGPSLQAYLMNSQKAIPLGNRVMEGDPSMLLYYKGQPDPHIWMDIALWSKTVPFIVEALSRKDPTHAEEYRKNGNAVTAALMRAHEEVKTIMRQIPDPKRYLVTSHDAFNYFTRAYLAGDGEAPDQWRERFASPEGLAPESQISTTDIQAIIDHLSKYKIHVIFPESNVSRDSIRKIVEAAKNMGMDIKIAEVFLYADAMGAPGSDGDTYVKMIQHNARSIAGYLNHNGG